MLRKDTASIRLRSVHRTAARSHYYSFVDKTGQMNPMIEKWFNPVEDVFPKLRQHLRDHIAEVNITGQATNLDPAFRRPLAEYVHIHIVRVPAVFDELKRQAVAYERQLSERHALPYDENSAKVMALRAMIRVGQSPGFDIIDALMRRTLDVEFFPRTRVSLATSDTPVIMHDETRSPGLAYDTTSVFFPLDSAIMLRFGEHGDHIRMIKRRDLSLVDPLNHLVGLRAKDEVYCRDPAVLVTIGRAMGLQAKIETKMANAPVIGSG